MKKNGCQQGARSPKHGKTKHCLASATYLRSPEPGADKFRAAYSPGRERLVDQKALSANALEGTCRKFEKIAYMLGGIRVKKRSGPMDKRDASPSQALQAPFAPVYLLDIPRRICEKTDENGPSVKKNGGGGVT